VASVHAVRALSIGPFEVTACVCGDAASYGICKVLVAKTVDASTRLWLSARACGRMVRGFEYRVGRGDEIAWGIFKGLAREIRLTEHTSSATSAMKM
jgi:hypothetical protein